MVFKAAKESLPEAREFRSIHRSFRVCDRASGRGVRGVPANRRRDRTPWRQFSTNPAHPVVARETMREAPPIRWPEWQQDSSRGRHESTGSTLWMPRGVVGFPQASRACGHQNHRNRERFRELTRHWRRCVKSFQPSRSPASSWGQPAVAAAIPLPSSSVPSGSHPYRFRGRVRSRSARLLETTCLGNALNRCILGRHRTVVENPPRRLRLPISNGRLMLHDGFGRFCGRSRCSNLSSAVLPPCRGVSSPPTGPALAVLPSRPRGRKCGGCDRCPPAPMR